MDATVKNRALARRIEPLLGPIAAALLGAASGFFCFAMPAALIGRTIDPAMVGGRLPLAVAVAVLAGTATWFAFYSLDRAARPRVRHIGAPEGEADAAPVRRRADSHPDAPARRPIFAGSDLGTPLDLIDPLPVDWREPDLAPPERIDSAQAKPLVEPVSPFRAMDLPTIPHPILPAAIVPPPAAAEPAPSRAAQPLQPLSAMMARLEAGLTRKALVLAGAEPNVTALKREIRPVGGTLTAAVEELRQRTAARR